MDDKHMEYLEKLYATDKNVAIISKDVEVLKEDVKDIKKSLQKLLDEPKNDIKFFREKIFSLIISGLALLIVLGFGVYVKQQTDAVQKIVATQEEGVDK